VMECHAFLDFSLVVFLVQRMIYIGEVSGTVTTGFFGRTNVALMHWVKGALCFFGVGRWLLH